MSCLRRNYQSWVTDLPYSEEFGLHSLHSGRGSAVAIAGVPDCLFKKHRWWKSENSKDSYIEDSLDSWLLVSRQIGL